MIPHSKLSAAPRLIQAALAVLALATACATSQLKKPAYPNDLEKDFAKSLGWREDLQRGQQIIDKLSPLNREELAKVDVSTYRGERVAFDGVGAPPGGSNDLLTSGGFHLRVINPSHKDLRPHCAWWEVMIRGTILEVLPQSKTIVIEVDEKNWQIVQTG
jgi:hypothetical protein